MRIQTKPLRHLRADEYLWCWRNNYGDEGDMRVTLEDYCERPTREASVTMIFEDDEPVAWSLRFLGVYTRQWHLHLWVIPSRRRRGYGRLLAGRARQGVRGPLVVYPTDEARVLYRPLIEAGRCTRAPGYS